MAWFLRIAWRSGLISRRDNAMSKHRPIPDRCVPASAGKRLPTVALAACAYDATMGIGLPAARHFDRRDVRTQWDLRPSPRVHWREPLPRTAL